MARQGSGVVYGPSYVGRGAAYLFRTPSIWKQVFCPLLISVLASLVILIVMLAAAFPGQALALKGTGMKDGWAWFLAFVLSLIEAALISVILVAIVYGQLQQWVFDKVYNKCVRDDVNVSLDPEETTGCCAECRGCGWFLGFKLALSLVTLPLNLVPILGNAVYAWINGWLYAWDLHRDYFAVHGVYSYKDQYEICKSDGFYNSFGVLALFVETLPVVGMFFLFANAAGAALYAAEHEPALRYLAAHPEKQPAKSASRRPAGAGAATQPPASASPPPSALQTA